MKKVLVIVISLFVLLFAGLWIYVANLDWNKHKDKIAEQIFELTGKKVVFEGPVTLTLLPSPNLTAKNVKVFNQQGDYSTKPLAIVKNLVAKVSLQSLFGDDWDIGRLSLVEPEIFIDIAENGQLNWISELPQSSSLKNNAIRLDSATLEKAKLHLTDGKNGIDTVLTNLNAEIIAENILGPYRVEGSYVRGTQPEGFAISLGQFTKSFATTVNLVVNYPTLKSYVRFDGSVFLADRSLKGNVVFESEEPATFLNEATPFSDVSSAYNFPLALSAVISANNQRFDLSNVIIKYGKTAAAGNVLIPFAEVDKKQKIELAFNMTDFDLEPFETLFRQFYEGYKNYETNYSKNWNIDLIADFKAIKAYYKNETFSNFSLSFDWIDKVLKVRELNADMFVDANFSLKGIVDASKDKLSYNFDFNAQTSDLNDAFQKVGIPFQKITPATYKKTKISTKINGDLASIQLSDLKLTLDNTSVSGDAGFVFNSGKVKSMFILNADMINLDNYLPKLFSLDNNTNFWQNIVSYFKLLNFFNELDTRVLLNTNLLIYNSTPYENVVAQFSLVDGLLNIENLQFNAWKSNFQASGSIMGFGNIPNFQNFNFNLVTSDASDLVKAFHLNAKSLNNLSVKSQLNGPMDNFNLKLDAKLQNLNVFYVGNVYLNDANWNLDGRAQLKNPDFVKFVNNLGFVYKPKAFSLGLLQLNTNIKGNFDKFSCSNVDLNIGSNNFKGDFDFDISSGYPILKTNLLINRFEFERFLQENQEINIRDNFKNNNQVATAFLKKPLWSEQKFDFSLFRGFDFVGDFTIDSLSYGDENLSNVQFNLLIKDAVVRLTDFKADLNSANLFAHLDLIASAEPKLLGNLTIRNLNLDAYPVGGTLYKLNSGMLSANVDFNTSIISENNFWDNFTANAHLDIVKPKIQGWNIVAIEQDLKERTESSGLSLLVQDNLRSGVTEFDNFNADISFSKGNYKFENAQFSTNKYSILLSAVGVLSEWSVEASFDVVWNFWKVMPAFKFMMFGSLDNPDVSVDIRDIVKMFDDKNAKLLEEQKAREEARLNQLKLDMNEQKEKAQKFKDNFEKNILARFNERNNLLQNESSKSKANDLLSYINRDISHLEEIFTLSMTPEYDEKLIQKAKEINDNVEINMSDYLNRIEKIYHDDVVDQLNHYFNDLKSLAERLDILNKQQQNNFTLHSQRLVKINSSMVLILEPDIAELKNSIANDFILLKNLIFDATKNFNDILKQDDIVKLAQLLSDLKTDFDTASNKFRDFDKNIGLLFDLCEKKVINEEETEKKRLQDEAIRQKVEENTSTISVDGSGKIMRVVPDIDDVNKSEKAILNNEVKVLDFSNASHSSGIVVQDNAPVIYEKTQPLNASIILKNSKSVSGVSGTVVRQ